MWEAVRNVTATPGVAVARPPDDGLTEGSAMAQHLDPPEGALPPRTGRDVWVDHTARSIRRPAVRRSASTPDFPYETAIALRP